MLAMSSISVLACTLTTVLPAADPAPLWWERGADRWYYKDDWKGLRISGARAFENAIEVPGGAASGWIVVWGDRGYRLSVNGREAGSSVDGGLIDDFDLSPLVAGADRVSILIEGDAVCAEGEVAGRDGHRFPFATGEDWTAAGGGKVAARKMAVEASTGAFHRAHDGRLLSYNDEERGKSAIAKVLARCQKLEDQGIYRMRRLRPAAEILSFDPAVPWRRAEAAAAPLLARARETTRGRAVPHQKAGRFSEAIAAAAEAAVLVAAAEAQVDAVAGLYEAEREADHLERVAAMLEAGTPPIAGAIAGLRDLALLAREEIARDDEATARKAIGRMEEGARDLRRRLEASPAAARLACGIGRADEFPEDRFGPLNARALMGNDPAEWPFAIVPTGAEWIDLAGRWEFRTDPGNEGEKAGWAAGGGEGFGRILAPGPWERQGFQEDNERAPGAPIGRGRTGEDKPYNGFAWYRKDVVVPEGWRGRDLVLVAGTIANWGRVFWNGKAIGEARPPEVEDRRIPEPRRFDLPAAAVDPGRPNRIAVLVYNHDNFGGIIAGPVAIHPKGSAPEIRETPGPLSIAREIAFPAAGGPARISFLAGALSPVVLLAAEGTEVEIGGWEAKGMAAPEMVPIDAGPGSLLLHSPDFRAVIAPASAPAAVAWKDSGRGGRRISIEFAAAPARLAVAVLPPGGPLDAGDVRLWAQALASIPTAASELVEAGPDPLSPRRYRIRYGRLPIATSPGPAPLPPLAPLPMLASYAIEHRHPGVRADGARETGYRSTHAAWRAVEGEEIVFEAPPVDRSRVLKGFGELFARSKVEENVHGGLGEAAMFRRAAEWGLDHCRYAIAFDADWDLPLVRSMGGPLIEGNEARWKRLEALVENCNAAGLQMMLCSFSEIGTRRWKGHPERERNIVELWRAIARRFKELPAWAISYDFFNEPACVNGDHWNRLMKDLVKVIREEDGVHTIVIESADGWAQPHWCLWMEPVGDPNVLYSFHHYGKHWGYAYDEYYPGYGATFERKMADPWLEAILFGIRHRVPIHCGEFGISMIQPGEDGEAWLEDCMAFFERFGIGWNWWNYSGGDIYRTGLAAGGRTSPFVPILSKWARRSGWGASRGADRGRWDPRPAR
jgi:hypothetical protein